MANKFSLIQQFVSNLNVVFLIWLFMCICKHFIIDINYHCYSICYYVIIWPWFPHR